MKRQWGWLLMSFALAVGSASIFGISQYRSHELKALGIQDGRTWTVCAQGCDFATVQQAVDTAKAGDRIWIKPGTYAEHLIINKTLSLEGSGAQETIIKGAQPNKPLIFIPEEASTIEVRLANLALIASFTHHGYPMFCDTVLDVGQCAAGIEAGGPAKLSLYHMRVSDHSFGIWVHGPARVELFESQIGSASIAGIALFHHDAEVTIANSEISVGYSRISYEFFPKQGLLAEHARRLTVMNSSFSSDEAIHADDQAQVTVINTRFSGGGVSLGTSFTGAKVQAVILNSEFVESGLEVGDESQITVVNSRFKKGGIGLRGQARAVIYGSEIVENKYTSGVLLYGKVQVHLERNKIADNDGWGIALWVPECGFTTLGERATPQISGRDNEIPDKDQPHGNKKGALCPPDYPWPPGFRK